MVEVERISRNAGASPLADLHDLLELERDAARAYALALVKLDTPSFRATVERFIEDHARHADELARLVRLFGGRTDERVVAEADAGPFERAVRAVRDDADDRSIIAVLKAAERSGRDRYRDVGQRACAPEVAAVMRRAANDEAAHYGWALETLDDIDAAAAAAHVERAIGRAGLAAGRLGARAVAIVGRAGRRLRGEIGSHPLRSAVLAVSVGMVAAAFSDAGAADGL